MSKDNTSGSRLISEVKQCLLLAVPLAAAQLAQSATGFVDTVMMGWLGSQTIASGGLGVAVYTFCLMITTGIIAAVSPLAAEAYGAGKPEQVGQIVRQGLRISLLLGIPITVLLWHGSTLLVLLGQDVNAASLAQTYLRAIAWGFIPALGFAVFKSFLSALSQPQLVMVTVVLGTLLNITANYVLMFGKFGLPALGLAGIGWASTLSLWSMFITLAIYVFSQRRFAVYKIFQLSSITNFNQQNWRIVWEIFQIGLPIGGLVAVEAGLFTVVTFIIGQLGTTALAAHQIALQTASMSFQMALGISLATTVRVGQLAGEENLQGVRLAGYVGIALGALSMAIAALIFWSVPKLIVSLYLDTHNSDNQDVVNLAIKLLAVAAIFQIVDGIQVTASGALRGLKDTRIPLLIGIFAYWCVGLLMGYALGIGFGYGTIGLWWGLAIGLASAAIVLSWRFRIMSSKWEKRD
ncbi:MATE family efflux transporter [Nostoc sp. FACHB-87]|uniref:MATE family efflux transporter n=1 Tax=Nostocales TaxID=1161 RepID=UPI001687B45B|nr:MULTISPECIES: MATE family efflux transporter [Nostocales]MBD2459404.1 MATE family efflux transporter [Nostoc sp. FACHB-87]MBD2479637.1 MATE family efflux transporter [Anabaena sp. FACHB-83]MBD2489645.1 MATE family efflux transporter [Aulosira sp. FACHB-615]